MLLLQKLQSVATNRVPGTERHTLGHVGKAAPQLLKEFLPSGSRHTQIGDNEVVSGFPDLSQSRLPIGRDVNLMPPRLERRADIVKDVGLIINHEHSQLTNGNWGGFLCRWRWRRRSSRKFNGEGGAFSRPGGEVDHPLVLLHNSLADREAKPRPFSFWLGRKERFERPGGERFIHSRAIIRHCYRDTAEPAPSLDPDRAGATGTCDGLRGVVDQVDEHLLDLNRIEIQFRHIGVAVELRLDTDSHDLIAEQGKRRLEESTHRGRPATMPLLPGKT